MFTVGHLVEVWKSQEATTKVSNEDERAVPVLSAELGKYNISVLRHFSYASKVMQTGWEGLQETLNHTHTDMCL